MEIGLSLYYLFCTMCVQNVTFLLLILGLCPKNVRAAEGNHVEKNGTKTQKSPGAEPFSEVAG